MSSKIEPWFKNDGFVHFAEHFTFDTLDGALVWLFYCFIFLFNGSSPVLFCLMIFSSQ